MEQILNLRTLAEGLKNRRDQVISPNTIFRSADISQASKTDIDTLRAHGIETIYDLRSRVEINKDKLTATHGFKIKHVEIMKLALQNDFKALINNSKSQNEEYMTNLYAGEFVQTNGFRETVQQIILRSDNAFLFHCTGGKDRTGILAAILMMIFDYDDEAIKEEYLKIDPRLTDVIAHKISAMLGVTTEQIPPNLEPLLQVKNSYLDAFVSSINNQYRSINDYIRTGLGVSEKEQDLLKAKYLKVDSRALQ